MQIKLPENRENNPGRTLRQIHSWLYQLNEQLRYLFSHLDEDNFSESFLSASLGETKALKTRVKDLEAPLKWVPLALTGVTSWSDDDAPMIGRAHGTVFLRGAVKDEQSQENWEFKNKPRSSGGRGSSREKQPDGDLARLVALAVAGAKKGSEKKRLSSGGKSGS